MIISVTPSTQWALGIDNMELCKRGGLLTTYFYPHAKEISDAELKRFVLALSEFVKDYK